MVWAENPLLKNWSLDKGQENSQKSPSSLVGDEP
ncbi:hypothetical protein CHRY9393_03573 [Chryseobacterium fistulae]|uniref:Uncharacterized protein n=1 Tax=Chryseobacterium fistulae TaxID=2675058 RepID=A0A6N4XWU4_9FLAO|nr:hypothetical protein CHRY9393_03573 [Chryseobacterium fistulae]